MTFLLRLGTLCGVVSGLFIALPGAVEAFTGETAPTSVVLALSPALAAPLLTALYLGQARAGGRLAAIGYAVNIIGLGLFGGAAFTLNAAVYFLDDPVLAGTTRALLLGSVALLVTGCVLFGLAMVRARVYPAAAAWAYTVVLPVFAFGARLPESVLTSALHVAAGATLIWLATAVRSSHDQGVPHVALTTTGTP
ncbi:hypothetical protein WEI85_14180 [Actinomycetes bacterium KLBMP 9797]